MDLSFRRRSRTTWRERPEGRETAGEPPQLVDRNPRRPRGRFLRARSAGASSPSIAPPKRCSTCGARTFIGKTIWEVSPTTVGTEFERRYRQVMTDREKQVFETVFDAPARSLSRSAGLPARRRDRRRLPRRHRSPGRSSRALRHRETRTRAGAGDRRRRRHAGRRARQFLGSPIARISAALRPAARSSDRDPRGLGAAPPSRRPRASGRAPFQRRRRRARLHYRSEYRIVRPSDGEVRWISAVAEIERDANGEAIALVGAHIDITERKLAEQEALASEESYAPSPTPCPSSSPTSTEDQVFRFANKTYESLVRPAAERDRRAQGRRSDEPRHVRGAAPLSGAGACRRGGFLRSRISPLDRRRSTEVVHVPHRDASGRVLGVYVVVTDITQRKLSERKIAESEARFRAIANSAPVPMWVTGANGRREFVNQAYLDFFGRSYEEALAFDWRKALHPDDLPRILREEPTVERLDEDVHGRGPLPARRRAMAVAARGIAAADGSPAGEHVGFIGVAHDVTEAKEAQEELTRINETLERRVAERTAAARRERSAGPNLLPALSGMPRGAGRGWRQLPLSGGQSGDPASLR